MGCSAAPDLGGTWVGERDVKGVPGADPLVLHQLATVKVIIKPDGQAFVSDAGLPKEGNISYSGGKAYVHVTSVVGKRIDEGTKPMNSPEIELTPTKDGKLQFLDPQGSDPKPIILERQPQPTR